MKRNLLVIPMLLAFLSSLTANGQHLFEEKYEGCNTARFALEKDTSYVYAPKNVIGQVLLDAFG